MDETEHYSSRDGKVLPMTLAFELDPDMVKVNQRNRYLGQSSSHSTVIVRTQADRQTYNNL